jgi:hypothetical protein
MTGIWGIIKMVAILAAATLLGNWFLSELKRARAKGAPWYQPYLTPPGILIILIILSPLILKILGVF